jgi:hypothetical protein
MGAFGTGMTAICLKFLARELGFGLRRYAQIGFGILGTWSGFAEWDGAF